MPPETELIKQQMSQTRAALTEKLENLENKVVGTVNTTTDTVAQTVQEVGATVRETTQNIRATMQETTQNMRATVRETLSSVRDAFDVTRQMHEHPWLLFGGSVFAGFVGGRVLEGLEQGRLPSLPAPPAEQFLPSDSELRDNLEAQPPARRRSTFGFLKALTDTFAPEIDNLKRAAVGMAIGLVRDKLSESVPPHMREHVHDVMGRIATKLGGEVPPPGAMFGRSEEDEESDGAHARQSMGMS